MKRIALFFVLACGFVCAVGCDEVKRRAGDTARGMEQQAINKGEEAARESGRKAVDAAADSASEKDSADAKKRDKLKGSEDDK